MRGYLAPGLRVQTNESQTKFQTLSRHRRTKLAVAANTTLLKADQWAKGGGARAEISDALEAALKSLGQKKK